MSYRHSSYEPMAHELPGRPLRPYNWVQWLGVLIAVAGGLLALSYLASRLGWLPELFDSPVPALSLAVIGAFLVRSRREPGRTVGEAELRRNRLWVAGAFLVSVAVVLVILLVGGER